MKLFTQDKIIIIPLIYIIVISIFMLWHGSWFSPDQFFIAALLIALVLGRGKQFIHDWSLPIVLFLGYECLHSLIPILNRQAHIFLMINFDRSLFGEVPSVILQHVLASTTIIHWYDYMSVLMYMSHFIMFMIIAFTFWLTNKPEFKRYTSALILLCYMAFITYIIFPAMPPWMASQKGYLGPVQHISDRVSMNFAAPLQLPSIYHFFGANQVSAVPSLHAAIPWLIFLFIAKKHKFLSLMFMFYVCGVWFAIMYLGDHYVFDILLGILYASIAFSIINLLPHQEIIPQTVPLTSH